MVRRGAIALALVAGVVVAGCGGKDNKPVEPVGAVATAQKAAGRVVVIDEIDPKAPVDRPFRATITEVFG